MTNINTFLVKGPQDPDPLYHGVVPPVYLTTTYHNARFGQPGAFGYSRGGNPTRAYLEALIAQLEEGKYGFAFASGMAANAAALAVLKAGDKLLVTRNVYGGTLTLLNNIYQNFGISYELIDTSDLAEVERRITPETKAVFIETPSNPMLDIADIAGLARLAKKRKLITIADNTFMSPYLQKPLALGADIVVESATKFLSGHSDVIAGVAATNSPELAERIGTYLRAGGSIAQPFDSYLLIRGLKTLGLRIDRQVANTEKIIAFLGKQAAVDKIYYPGLPDHPGRETHARQAKAPGSLLSFELNEAYDIRRFFDAFKILTHGASLGSVETLLQNPASGSHRQFSPGQLAAAGIKPTLIRLSVGIEDPQDVIEDLRQAFQAAAKA
ncbi:MAG: PLP-dependent aspartate aminotransferase family protein [Peptococcaceae bacterium]|jgi:cystathionine beta-lyase|nr:PLP-dependent aspartate aminotransferase family protein [Peptococcaceae bacterium]